VVNHGRVQLKPVVELRGGPRGPGPLKKSGGPLETSGLRGYKGASWGPLNGPLEITRQIQYVLQYINIILSTDGDIPSPAT